MQKRASIPVAVLGCTGAVGQRFLQLLKDHPWFHVVALGASEKNDGKSYESIVQWQLSDSVPEKYRALPVSDASSVQFFIQSKAQVVFSALETVAAAALEPKFAEVRDASPTPFRSTPQIEL